MPSGPVLLSGGKDETIRIWNHQSGAQIAVLQEGYIHPVWCASMHPGGGIIAEGSFGWLFALLVLLVS